MEWWSDFWGWVGNIDNSEIVRNWVLVAGAFGAAGIAVWRGLVADRASRAALRQAELRARQEQRDTENYAQELIRTTISDLEDGSEAVRYAALLTLQRLAIQYPQFGNQIAAILASALESTRGQVDLDVEFAARVAEVVASIVSKER